MQNLEKALALMDSLSGQEPIEYIIKVLNEAYAYSDHLLDAKILLSRLTNDYKEREDILVQTIKHGYTLISKERDEFVDKQYLRALVELDSLYQEMQCLPLRMKTLQEIYRFKAHSLYNPASKLYSLYAYFDRIDDTAVFVKDVLPEYKYLVDMIYAYERNDYESAKKNYMLLKDYNIKLIEVFNAEDDDENYKSEAKILSELAYYINRNNRIINYINEGVSCD